MKTIVDELREAIEKVGVYRVAKETELTVSQVSRFVKGERGLALENAARIAAFLDLGLRDRKGGK